MRPATPSRATRLTRAPWRAAASSATSAPMEWPTRAACSIASASSRVISQSAMAGTESSAGPSDLPWPGRSSASTLRAR